MSQDNSDDKPKTPNRISNAPPPISPLRGSGYTGLAKAPIAPDAIDWQHWRIVKKVAAWEAVLLSFGTNPETAGIDWRDLYNYPSENEIKIIKRLRQLEGYQSDGTFFSHVIFGNHSRVHEFSLPEFAAWGLHVGFDDMPPELVAMAQKREAQAQLPADSKPTAIKPVQRAAAQNAAIIEAIRAKNIEPKKIPKAPSGKPGLKAEIRKDILQTHKDTFSSNGVFDDAWQRLRSSGEIIDA